MRPTEGGAATPFCRRGARWRQKLGGAQKVCRAQRMYGQAPEQMRLMLCGLCASPAAGDGVCVDVAPDADPDFRVVWAARWPGHWEAHLQLIPPAERGPDA